MAFRGLPGPKRNKDGKGFHDSSGGSDKTRAASKKKLEQLQKHRKKK